MVVPMVRALIFLLMLLALPAQAQSILRDAETEAFFRDLNRPLAEAAGLNPRSVQVLLIGDPEINAFVAGGQNVFFHSGLILAADNVNQVQGVHAHELGHIAGGHGVRTQEAYKAAGNISILSLVLGVAAVAAGAPEAGLAAIAGGQQAAMANILAYSQAQESTADQAGALYLEKTGTSGRGSIDFFKKLQNQEFRYAISQSTGYGRTHPLTGERIANLEERYRASPNWNRPTDPALEARFQRIKAKLTGYIEEPARTLRLYPEGDTSVPARYARAYAWHKSAEVERARSEVDALLAAAPEDPWFLELKGQILLESGRVNEAIPPLRRAVQLSRGEPLIAALLGHALISDENGANDAEAERVLRAAVDRDNENPFAWYQLGVVFARRGDEPRAALASAERYSLQGRPQLALINAERAMRGLPKDSRDFIRAEDIVLVSRQEVEQEKKKRR